MAGGRGGESGTNAGPQLPTMIHTSIGRDPQQASRPLVSLVLPCLNEVDGVGLCVDEATEALSRASIVGEVVVVDNGSTDGTADVARGRGARVVNQPEPGYGSALRAGILAARAPVVVMADADCTYDLGKIPELVRPILDGDADLVLGSRVNGANRLTMPFLHRFVGTPAITFLIARASGGRITVQDSQSGFRAFRRQTIVDLGLDSSGMEFASEMLIRASQAGLRISEIPAGYRPRVGQSKLNTLSDGWRHLQLILALAPDLLLVGPGVLLLAVGLVVSALGLVDPGGVQIGSLRWQPIFFSSIALVLGTQALLAGTVVAHRLSVLSGSACTRFRFAGDPSFPAKCLRSGVVMSAIGLAIDAALFVGWVSGRAASSRDLVVASLAQSLLIIGATFVTFAVVSAMVVARCPSAGAVQGEPTPTGSPVLVLDTIAVNGDGARRDPIDESDRAPGVPALG